MVTPSKFASTPRTRRGITRRKPGRCCSIASHPIPASASTPATANGDAVSVHYDPLIAKLIALG